MKNEKLFAFVLSFFLISSLFIKQVYSESEYVLPYPSFMPGHILYKPKEIVDEVKQYFYFGDFAKFKYHLQQSDKYLVEAKILFEYKQYFLGAKALEKSNENIKRAMNDLYQANKNGKNVNKKQNILKNASIKHIELLISLLSIFPKSYTWTAEKGDSMVIELKEIITDSIELRKSCI